MGQVELKYSNYSFLLCAIKREPPGASHLYLVFLAQIECSFITFGARTINGKKLKGSMIRGTEWFGSRSLQMWVWGFKIAFKRPHFQNTEPTWVMRFQPATSSTETERTALRVRKPPGYTSTTAYPRRPLEPS